jgi:hypothetical protein
MAAIVFRGRAGVCISLGWLPAAGQLVFRNSLYHSVSRDAREGPANRSIRTGRKRDAGPR